MPRHQALFLAPALLILLTAATCPGESSDGASTGSGSSKGSGTTDPSSPPIPADCPVPVCRYAGTSWAEDLIGDELLDRGEAKVDWRFSHMSGREAVYVPAGSVTASWRTEHCAITLEPAAKTFGSADPSVRHSRLNVDFTVRPVRYSGTGSSGWEGTQVWTCRNDTPFTQEGVSTLWFRVHEAYSDDPGLLRGTATTETGRSSWEFVNAP